MTRNLYIGKFAHKCAQRKDAFYVLLRTNDNCQLLIGIQSYCLNETLVVLLSDYVNKSVKDHN